MKKAVCLLLALCMVFALGACGHEHSWVNATCTLPKTCSECGETEGEPLGHEWIPATCTQPKTCPRCGETEGEPLGHSVTEADYWNGSVCTVCGEVFSEPLEPDFVKYGLDAYVHDVGTGEEFTYVTCGWSDGQRQPDYDAVASVRVYAAKLVDENENAAGDNWVYLGNHMYLNELDETILGVIRRVEAMEDDSYEWVGLYADIQFTDWPHGCSMAICQEDYYDIVGHDEKSEVIEEPEDGNYTLEKYPVNYMGKEQNVYRLVRYKDYVRGSGHFCYEYYFYVPKGYDGCVFGLFDGALAPDGWAEGTYVFDYINENMLLFRLKAGSN